MSVTDIWFRSSANLEHIAEHLGLSQCTFDEDYWEWVIGNLDRVPLDITRTHTCLAEAVDTRIFGHDNQPFSNEMQTFLIRQLRKLVRESIKCGNWNYVGNKFTKSVIEQFDGWPTVDKNT